MPISEIRQFRSLDSRTAGHPEYHHAAGIETTTGPLGQGFANAVGMGHRRADAGRSIRPNASSTTTPMRSSVTVVLWKASAKRQRRLPGHLCLDKLIVLFDDNGITIDGAVSLSDSTQPICPFSGIRVEYGNSGRARPRRDTTSNQTRAQKSAGPSLVCCRTRIGYGAPNSRGNRRRPRGPSRRGRGCLPPVTRTAGRTLPSKSPTRCARPG